MKRILIILLTLAGFAASAQTPVSIYYLRMLGRDTVASPVLFPSGYGGVYYNVTTGKMMYKDATGYHRFGTGTGGGGGGGVSSIAGTSNRITVTGTSSVTLNISPTFEALLGKLADPLSQFAPTTSAQLRSILTDEVGTGQFYTLGGALGTPASATGTNFTGIPITGLNTFSSAQLRTQLTDEVGSGAIYTVGGALGTPASGTATNLTGLPITGLASGTSANLSAVLSDEVGTGPLYFGQPIEATTSVSISTTLSTSHYSEYSYSGLIRTTNTGPINITVPTNATAAIPVKTKIALDNQGSDTVTVVWAGGVTHNDGGYVEIPPHSSALLYKVATNEWDLLGTGPGGTGGGTVGTGECLWETSSTATAHTFDVDDVAICNNSGIIRYTGTTDVNFTMPAFATEAFEQGTGIVVNNQSETATITIVFSGGITGGNHVYNEIGPGETATLINAGTDVWDLLGTRTAGETAWTSWTPTFTGFSGSVTGTARYKLEGKTLFIRANVSGTSNAAGFSWTFTLPAGMTAAGSDIQVLRGQSLNSGAAGDAMLSTAASSNIITVYREVTGSLAWTASGTKGLRFNGFIEIN